MGNFDNDLFVKRIKIKDKIEPQLFEEYPLNINAIRISKVISNKMEALK